eukprot:UN05055
MVQYLHMDRLDRESLTLCLVKNLNLRNAKGRHLPIDKIKFPPVHEQGLIPRCVSYIFGWLKSRERSIRKTKTTISVYEIYVRDSLKDLLNKGHALQKIDSQYR